MNELVPLSILALEVPGTPDELAARLSDEFIIADELGRRSVPVAVAREMIEAEARRRYEQAEAERKRRAEHKERIREIKAKYPIPRGVALDVPEGMTPAAALVAAGGTPQYAGGTYRPVPGRLDWTFGGAEGGASIGPPPREVARAARERAEARKRAKRGGAQ